MLHMIRKEPIVAHPRSRGENFTAKTRPFVHPGSSPLTRGKQVFRGCTARVQGLIPAHAGKTLVVGGRACPPRAHPRSRGENSTPFAANWAVMWLIPAHAGKTPTSTWRPSATAAHPRSRGENAELGFTKVGGSGSSPLTRGKHTRPTPSRSRQGLIPAHAGKTRPPVRNVRRVRAHPRSRGENCRVEVDRHRIGGSSPLTRGKPGARRRAGGDHGLIPAHAGKTPRSGPTSTSRPAHPRSRGENASRS